MVMKCCYGPCEQGRRKCPTPEMCQVETEEPTRWWDALVSDTVVAVLAVTVIGLMVWGWL